MPAPTGQHQTVSHDVDHCNKVNQAIVVDVIGDIYWLVVVCGVLVA